ncbi:MAG: hypothetical protein K9J16_13600 [Melioribacteraceae bacterium]|nr:hypothetical protein [Melioribacteraceae bacterium]MCF8356496.1 hypothetical protein [Melioribacteraceae bacterium]MCF8394851.1 hypothetical protein [Melioribacteraceae bacterium]MCF8420579.1 hypothetical protein [Melioribacteraceae bacterium]
MNKNEIKNKWSIEKGDYERETESTSLFEEKQRRKKTLISVLKIVTYFSVLILVTLIITY